MTVKHPPGGFAGRYRAVSPILKLDHDDEDAERAFELDYLLSLTTKERFEMMIARSDEIKRTLLRHGYRKPFESVKRPCH